MIVKRLPIKRIERDCLLNHRIGVGGLASFQQQHGASPRRRRANFRSDHFIGHKTLKIFELLIDRLHPIDDQVDVFELGHLIVGSELAKCGQRLHRAGVVVQRDLSIRQQTEVSRLFGIGFGGAHQKRLGLAHDRIAGS